MYLIRKSGSSDLAQIKACAIAAYTPYVERIGKQPAPMIADFAASIAASELYVIEADAQILGFVVCYARNKCLHLENVAVDPCYQGRGLGTKLIEFAEQQACSVGLDCVELYTNAKMTENLGLYPRLGYVEFDRRREDGFDRVYFKKML